MAIWSRWLGGPSSLRDGGAWSMFFGQDTWAGKSVSVDSAMQIATVWSCVRLIAETVATLPLGLYARDEAGVKRSVGGDLYTLLHDAPNADQTAVEFWESQIASLCLWGNSYAEKQMQGERVIGLRPLPPDTTYPFRSERGALRYRLHDRGKEVELPEDRVFHIRGFGTGGDVGLSPVTYARQTLGIAMAADESAARTFSNGMRPSGFFLFDQLMKPEQREQARRALIDPMTGSGNAARAGILEAGVKWQSVTMNPVDAEMMVSRKWHVEEICRWFRTPPVLIGHASEGQTMWGSGIEQIMLGWLTLGLRTYLKRVEAAINRRLIPVGERSKLFAEFNVEGLLRADSAGRAEFYSKMIQNGGMTSNEMRAKENMPPKDGGDVLLINSTLIPLDQAGRARPPARPTEG